VVAVDAIVKRARRVTDGRCRLMILAVHSPPWGGAGTDPHGARLSAAVRTAYCAPVNPVVEAFRGMAALMVLAHHYADHVDRSLVGSAWHALHNGVDLFFVISGYLFAPHLLGRVREPLAAFALRRAFRLYPLYLASLAVAVAKDWGQRDGLAWATTLHLLFLQALPVFSLAEVGYFSEVYWTLPVEVMFYGLVAAMMVLGAGTAAQRTVGLGLVAVVGFVTLYGLPYSPRNETWVVWQAQLPALLLQFWFGMMVYVCGPALRRSPAVSGAAALLGGTLLVSLLVVYPTLAASALTARPFGAYNLLSGLGYALVLAASLAAPALVADGWLRRAALWAGATSYGTYLFHEWALKVTQRLMPQLPGWVQVSAAAVGTLVLATLLHHSVEKPLRGVGRRLAERFRP
jgi:peptidoglycan/LPS O-acetylase OafA/YrhL